MSLLLRGNIIVNIDDSSGEWVLTVRKLNRPVSEKKDRAVDENKNIRERKSEWLMDTVKSVNEKNKVKRLLIGI